MSTPAQVTVSPARLWASRLVRIAVVVLVIAAEISIIVEVGPAFEPVNHYSYFTVLSNIFGAVVLAVALARPVPDVLRGAAVTYLGLTGIVYNTMLRGIDVQTPGFANEVLHVIVPILMVADWILAPPTVRITGRHILIWMAAPIAYLVYTLIRGPFVDWYPYPFLDPRPNGYLAVVIGSVLVALVFALAAFVVAWTGNRLRALALSQASSKASSAG